MLRVYDICLINGSVSSYPEDYISYIVNSFRNYIVCNLKKLITGKHCMKVLQNSNKILMQKLKYFNMHCKRAFSNTKLLIREQ